MGSEQSGIGHVDWQTRQDEAESEHVANAMLSGAGFSGFTFSTSFTPRFSRNRSSSFLGKPLPTLVELDLDSTWWLDDEEGWRTKIARLAPEGAVEPEEPVQAYELANLRWTEGATVVSVLISAGTLAVRFQNGRTLTVMGATDRDHGRAWSLTEARVDGGVSEWSVCSEGRATFVRAPSMRPLSHDTAECSDAGVV